MARKPETTWELLNVAMSHFQEHIRTKKLIWELSLVDLLHVSNFKGGNASITEPMATLPAKLKHYESALRDIETNFKKKALNNLTEDELTQLTGHWIRNGSLKASEIVRKIATATRRFS